MTLTTKTFRNANFKTRNYECTNVVCCQAPSLEAAQLANPNAKWVECKASEVRSMETLWEQGGVVFFGWL